MKLNESKNKLQSWMLVMTFLGLNALISPQAKAQSPKPYDWNNVQVLAGGFVTGVVYSTAEKDLIYARTDVGGAYRWNAANSTWIAITDHLDRSHQNFTGILSIAADPGDANRVYLATGLYTQSWAGTGAVLASNDKGNTWTTTNLTIKLGGNESGRSTGERLQVDPNKGNILFLGSSTDGLWKSMDYGTTWNKVTSFPVATSTIGSGGISFVLFDKSSSTAGSATKTIYVGVLQTGNTLYKSTDGGDTWQVVPNQPLQMPHHAALAADGMLYLAYCDGAGPNGISTGGIWKLNTTGGQWTALVPPSGQGGYGGISIDPQKPGTIVVSTLDRWWPGDEIFKSTDGGATWKALLATATKDHSSAPYAASSKPHWLGDVDIDPFNSDNAWFVTGYGVYYCNNLTSADQGKSTKWAFQNKGLEETVPLSLISPPSGARLLSAIGDIDGFRHEQLNTSPASGRLSPLYGTNTSIDFAEKRPNYIVRTYNNSASKYGAFSINGGKTWTAFSNAPSGATGGGSIAVGADSTCLVWSPGGTSVYYSKNNGISWQASSGVAAGLKIIADRENPKKFYCYDAKNGRMLVSIDGGAIFSAKATGLPTVPDWQLWAASINTVFGKEGDMWLVCPIGLYRSVDSGTSFQKISNIQEAVKVGFGKAATDQGYPSVFIAGKKNNITGFFRSDDAGATWERINDDQHQYGGINALTGDPRIYGRVYIATGGRGIVYGQPQGTIDNDCHGTPDGIAYLDKCNVCVAGNTGLSDCVVSAIEDEEKSTFSFFPNPFTNTMRLESAHSFEYRITDAMGLVLETGKCLGDCLIGRNLKPGVYVILIHHNNEKVRKVKIVKF